MPRISAILVPSIWGRMVLFSVRHRMLAASLINQYPSYVTDIYGTIVKRLRHSPFTAGSPVQIRLVSCHWTPCNRLNSTPTKISTGITGDSGFLASKGYMTWRYVINTDTGMKEARKIRNGYETGDGARFDSSRLTVRLHTSTVEIPYICTISSVVRAVGS